MVAKETQAAAALLLDARKSGLKLIDLPPSLAPVDLDAAYQIQDLVASSLAGTCGWKIGLTSKQSRAAFNASMPISGRLFAKGLMDTDCKISVASSAMRGIEAEIVCIVGPDVPDDCSELSTTEVGIMIAGVTPAIEVCDSRFVDCDHVGLRQIVADNANGELLVVGKVSTGLTSAEVGRLSVSLAVGVKQKALGSASAVHEHPFRAVQWLATHLQRRGMRLSPGEMIATGSMTGFLVAEESDTVTADFGPLGTVRAQFVTKTFANN